MAMLLAGPDLHGERVPFVVDLSGIEEGLGRVAAERIAIEPWAGEPLGQPGIAQHGSLVIDSRGEAWLAYRGRARPSAAHLSLHSFQVGLPAAPILAYPMWRIVINGGGDDHELVAFAPGRTLGPGTR